MKKIFKLVLLIIVVTSFTSMTAYASKSSKIIVTVNDKTINYTVSPYLSDSQVMVPVRQTAEALGAEVKWDKKSKTAWINHDMMHVELIVGKSEFYIHRDADFSGIPQTVKLKQPIKKISGRVIVPAQLLFENMGMSVDWDSTKRIMSITDNNSVSVDIPYTAITKEDISKLQEVYSWYNENYAEAGIHYYKQDDTMYVLISAGIKPTGGYSIGIHSVTLENSSKAFVSAYLNAPSPDMMVTQVETFPHVLIKLEESAQLTQVVGEISAITLPADTLN